MVHGHEERPEEAAGTAVVLDERGLNDRRRPHAQHEVCPQSDAPLHFEADALRLAVRDPPHRHVRRRTAPTELRAEQPPAEPDERPDRRRSPFEGVANPPLRVGLPGLADAEPTCPARTSTATSPASATSSPRSTGERPTTCWRGRRSTSPARWPNRCRPAPGGRVGHPARRAGVRSLHLRGMAGARELLTIGAARAVHRRAVRRPACGWRGSAELTAPSRHGRAALAAQRSVGLAGRSAAPWAGVI